MNWRSIRQYAVWLVTIEVPRDLPTNVNKDEVDLCCGDVQPSWLTWLIDPEFTPRVRNPETISSHPFSERFH